MELQPDLLARPKILFAKRSIGVHIALMESAFVPRAGAQPRDRESLAKGLAAVSLSAKARLLHHGPAVPFFVGLFSTHDSVTHTHHVLGNRTHYATRRSRYATHSTHTISTATPSTESGDRRGFLLAGWLGYCHRPRRMLRSIGTDVVHAAGDHGHVLLGELRVG